MPLRKLHFAVGLVGAVAFLVTGIYMNAGFPELYGANEVLRYIYRSNHVYILLASLINVFTRTRHGRGRRKQAWNKGPPARRSCHCRHIRARPGGYEVA